MKTADSCKKKLNLVRHPEGGWYREVYRSDDVLSADSLPDGFVGKRCISTAIYYLLEGTDFSAFHRIKSDEIWHYYQGTSAVEILFLNDGKLRSFILGNDFENNQEPQFTVTKNTWFAARNVNSEGFALMGCTVSPGFHFEDFELADENLFLEFPELEKEIASLIRI